MPAASLTWIGPCPPPAWAISATTPWSPLGTATTSVTTPKVFFRRAIAESVAAPSRQ